MNRTTAVINLMIIFGAVSSFLINPTQVQAGYSEREQQLSTILSSAVEFRWDGKGNAHESLGTKVNAHTVLTHNHFTDLAGTYIVDPSNPRRPHGVSNKTKTTPIGSSWRYRAQTRLVHSAVAYDGSFAPIASQNTINRLRVGDSVDVVYWDDARSELAVAVFQIDGFRDGSVLVLTDPSNIINRGDSGGGVFFDGELIGNTWRYSEIIDQHGNVIDKTVHVQIVPSELTNGLGTK